jgi:hypothetical protein
MTDWYWMTLSERLAWWLTKLQNGHAGEDFALGLLWIVGRSKDENGRRIPFFPVRFRFFPG